MSLPKLVFTDIDGVWTDGGMYYDESGNEWKKFHTYDSAGVLFLKRLGILTCFISGESSLCIQRRADKLNIDHVILDSKSKLEDATRLTMKLGIEIKDCAYIGDDINDLTLLSHVGYSAAPISALDYVKSKVQIVTRTPGGKGAFREFVETMLLRNGYGKDWFVKAF